MLDQDNNLYLISLNILITCLLDNVRILLGEVSCWSLLGIEGLSRLNLYKFCTTGIQGLTKGYFLQCNVFLVNNFFFFQYLHYEVWVITHQEQELVEKMEQQVYHVIT